jgi:multidrug efflux pump subunit AcrB
VASVDLIGDAEKRVEVELDPDKLKYKGLSTDAVVGAVSGAQVDVPVGSVPFDGLEPPSGRPAKSGVPKHSKTYPLGSRRGNGCFVRRDRRTVAGSRGRGGPRRSRSHRVPVWGVGPSCGESAAPTGVPSGVPSGAVPVRPNNNTAQAFIHVEEGADVGRALDRVDERGDELYGENFSVEIISNGPPQGGLEAILTGGFKEELALAAEEVSVEFERLDSVNNVVSDLSGGNPEITVNVDPEKAAKAGLSPSVVSGSLTSLLGESTLTTLRDAPVIVGVPEGSVDSLEEVRALPVGSGTTVGDVAEVERVESPAAISRTDGERTVTVTGEITSTDTQTVSTEARNAVAELDLPGALRCRSAARPGT